jgi:hypothetical protein
LVVGASTGGTDGRQVRVVGAGWNPALTVVWGWSHRRARAEFKAGGAEFRELPRSVRG